MPSWGRCSPVGFPAFRPSALLPGVLSRSGLRHSQETSLIRLPPLILHSHGCLRLPKAQSPSSHLCTRCFHSCPLTPESCPNSSASCSRSAAIWPQSTCLASFFLFFIIFNVLFPTPTACGTSQARGRTLTTAVTRLIQC